MLQIETPAPAPDARLLEHTKRSVGDVSAEAGFASPSYFSRQFHCRFGVSPRGYRAAYRSAPAPPRVDG